MAFSYHTLFVRSRNGGGMAVYCRHDDNSYLNFGIHRKIQPPL